MAKDKRAAELKKKRQRERQAERDDEIKRVVDGLKEYEKKHGIHRKISKDTTYRIYNQLNREIIVEAIMNSLISTMYCLNVYCGFGQERLFEYSRKVQRIITAIGQQTRSIKQLEGEIICETGVDIKALFDGYTAYGGKKQHSEAKMRAAVVMNSIPNGIIMCLYVLYFDYGWKHTRMARIADWVKDTAIKNVENVTITDLIGHIKQKCRLNVRQDGNIERIGIK